MVIFPYKIVGTSVGPKNVAQLSHSIILRLSSVTIVLVRLNDALKMLIVFTTERMLLKGRITFLMTLVASYSSW